MARWAIGDVQGCGEELRALLAKIRFDPARDRLWFVGDLVNRGPQSLESLRFVRGLGASATVVLGNHDLHLLARARGTKRAGKRGDTLNDVLAAPDREELLDWLASRPLAHFDAGHGDLLVHGAVLPQWSVDDVLGLAREVEAALRNDARGLLDHMYGDRPDRWSESLRGYERLRVIVNVLTRMRACTNDGRIDLREKGPPDRVPPPLRPWFEIEARATRSVRVIFGHWSALGFYRANGVVGLDTGCVWGGSLTAFDLDGDGPPVSVPCAARGAAQGD
jgi:bis(5'-nucleosyl)-tetraphosphatase (symmetrical)